ncbi:MerR family transcriptional regulator [Neobacillus sp. LXY-4]|uniref:MerR family transcriptional regulator n=1 Tax=Neobacillus sp. LXY-4 TaxID=3379826 RepID=UPI003EDF7331
MNTSEVAKLLGVSTSTIKRWVKQLDLPMERNERGHYLFNNETIDHLKSVQNQINAGILLHEIAPLQEKVIRKGTVKFVNEKEPHIDELAAKIETLERRLNEKADSVASYQLLQHRREIEDLTNQVKTLSAQIESLEGELLELKNNTETDLSDDFGQHKKLKNIKKKNILSSLFGF